MADSETAATPHNPRLVVIIGPAAVGKMTVGQELAKLTGWPLLFNHQVIDLVTPYFAYGTDPANRLMRGFSRAFFRESAQAGMSLITTFGWRFESETEREDTEVMWSYIQPYLAHPQAVCFAELFAPLGIRLARNLTENRRKHKNTEWATDEDLRSLHNAHRWNSNGDFPFDLPHMVLDNSELTAAEAALAIASHFGLPILPASS